MTNQHLITPCPVCGLVSECPHTPVRCQHGWTNLSRPFRVPEMGDVRECEHCGRTEKAILSWVTVKA